MQEIVERDLLISFWVAEKSFLQLICSTFTCQAESRSRETGIAQKVNDIWIAKIAAKAERENVKLNEGEIFSSCPLFLLHSSKEITLEISLKSTKISRLRCLCQEAEHQQSTHTDAAAPMFSALIAAPFSVWLLHWKMLKVVKTVGIVQGAKAGKHWAFLIFSQCFFVWRERLVVSRAVFHKNRAQKRCSSQVYKKTRSGKTLAFDFRFVAGKPLIGGN